jgi:hypothetical protein
MPKTVYYGRALYFPYVNFSDIKWLKTAALYYEGLDRIVPAGYSNFRDQEIIKKLNENERFIQNIEPGQFLESVDDDFVGFGNVNLQSSRSRSRFLDSIKTVIPLENTFDIDSSKISTYLNLYLLMNRLKFSEPGESPFSSPITHLEPVAGAMYMTFLANAIANDKQLPLVTDDPVFQPLIRYIQNNRIDTRSENMDIGQILGSMVIETVVPENIEAIPIEKIMKFRKKYNDERHIFYKEINGLVKDLEGIDNQTTLKECLEFKRKDVEIAVKNLNRAFRGIGLATTTMMLGLSVPAVASGLGPMVAGAGLIAMATGKLISQGVDYYKAKAASPYSYVLSLKNNLKSQTFAEQLLNGSIVL